MIQLNSPLQFARWQKKLFNLHRSFCAELDDSFAFIYHFVQMHVKGLC